MRRMDRAHNAPVLAVHIDVRPPPGVSIDTPLVLYGSGGWGRKVCLDISSPPNGDSQAASDRCTPAKLEDIFRAVFFPGLLLIRIRLAVLFGPP